MKHNEQEEIIKREFGALGFNIIHWNEKPTANGVDVWVQKNKQRPLSVEIKQAKPQKNGCIQIDPVLPNRRKDDLIAIILNSEYVLIEPMQDHLKACSQKGTRQMTILCKGL